MRNSLRKKTRKCMSKIRINRAVILFEFTYTKVIISLNESAALSSCAKNTIVNPIYCADPFKFIVPIGNTNCEILEFIFKSSITLNMAGNEAALKNLFQILILTLKNSLNL